MVANITLSDSERGFKRQLKTFLFQQCAWLTLHQRLGSLGFYGALEICILLLLLLARTQCAFQVSQGSVETLFIWGGKRLHHFASTLVRKPYTKFHQNRSSFVDDYKKNIWSRFSGHSVDATYLMHQKTCIRHLVRELRVSRAQQ